jgi:hypothetical protein
VAYAAALAMTQAGEAPPKKTMQADRRSLAWLCLSYYQSADFDDSTLARNACAD